MTQAGRETVGQGDSEATMEPGDAVVWDSTKPARFHVWEPVAKRSLLIPCAAVRGVDGRAWMPAGLLLNGKEPASRLLVS